MLSYKSITDKTISLFIHDKNQENEKTTNVIYMNRKNILFLYLSPYCRCLRIAFHTIIGSLYFFLCFHNNRSWQKFTFKSWSGTNNPFLFPWKLIFSDYKFTSKSNSCVQWYESPLHMYQLSLPIWENEANGTRTFPGPLEKYRFLIFSAYIIKLR